MYAIYKGINADTIIQQLKTYINFYNKSVEEKDNSASGYYKYNYHQAEKKEFKELEEKEAQVKSVYESTLEFLNNFRNAVKEEASDSIGYSILGTNLENNINSYYITSSIQKIFIEDTDCFNAYYNTEFSELKKMLSALDSMNSTMVEEDKIELREYEVETLKAKVIALIDYIINIENTKLFKLTGQNTEGQIEKYSEKILKKYEDLKSGYSEETKEQYEALIADMLSVENHYAEELLSATEAASENSGKYKTEDIISGYEAAKIEVSKFLLEANTINASSEDYGNIIDCCVELYGKLKNVSNTYSSYIAEYLNMYLQKEAFRYQLLSEKSADDYKSMLGKISTELRQTEESLIKEDEVDNENIRLGDDALLKLVRLNFEYTFISAAYEQSVNNSVEWLKTLGELKFASQTRLSDEDKALYASMIENRAENYMTECQKEMNIILEAAGMSKESYDALSEEDIQKLRDQNVKYQGALETEADYLSRINISSGLFAQLNQTVTQAALDAKIAEIAAAEKNSQQKQQLYEAAIKNLQKAADEYNTYLDKTNDLYENTQEARLEKRKAQAVYDWAESVYLGTIGENTESTYETPKEAVSSAEYSLNRAMLSVKILNDIKKEKVTTSASPEEQAYIDAERQYYLSYVMFEHQNASVQEVFRNLEEAENEENIKRNSVVTSSAGFNFSKYVNLTYDESTKSYRYALSNGSNNTSEETQRKFFLAKTESIERTTTANLSVTRAEVEVMDFLERMTGNQSYFNNVILAAMYYLSEKDGSYENSIYSSAVNSDSGITNSSGTNASDRLKDYTIEAARNAYNSLVASGKTEDIARCILFRNSNSVFASNIKKIEKNLVRSIAFARLENRMEERQGEWGCYYIIISFFRRKRTLTSKGRAAEAMERAACARKNGAVSNYNNAYSNITRALDAFKTSKNNVASKQGEYNKALYGSAVKPEGKLTSSQIKNYLTDVFVNKTSLSIDEINSLIAEIKDEDEFTDTNEAVRIILERSGQKTDAAYEAMSGRLATERKSQAEASDTYNGQLIKEIHISDEVKAELKKLAQKAADATLTVEQRKKAVEEYDRLYATIDWKEDEEELRNLAGKAYGEGTLCISDHYKNLFDYYRNYFDGNLGYSHLNLNNGKDAYWFDDAETVNSGKVSVVSEYLQFYQELLAERAANKFDEYKAGLDQNLKSFGKENEDVLTQLNKIVLIAGNEWDKAGEKLNAQYNTWHRDFNRTYVNASREWQESYEEFLSDKQQWITQMYMSAGAETGYSDIDADEQARKSLKKAKAEKVNGVEKVSFDATEYIEKLIGTTALSALNSHMDQLESRIGSSRLIADRNYKADAAAVTALFESMNIIDEVTAAMEKTAARLVAQDAAAQLDESIESAYKSVETANKSFEDNIREMVYDAGYTWEGNKISRRVLKHAYLFTDDYTTQTIHCYEWYSTNRPELTVTSAMFDGLEGDGVISLMNAATMQLTDWQEKVFGIHNGTVEKEGEFDKHIGKAPDGTDGGSGEFGRIMLDFSNNENEMQAGLAEMAAAPWDRKIAPSPVSWMEMPSLRTVGTVAAAVAATVVSAVVSVVSFGTMAAPMAALCAAGISAAITLSTEATFAALDVSGGYKSWDEVGKSLAISAATSAIGALGGAAGAAVGSIGGIGGALLKTGISVGTSAASTVTSNAIQYAGDWDGFKNSMTSFDTWRGTLTSGAGALVTNSLNGINYDGFNGGQIGKIGNFSSLAGGLASNALEYGLTGETTFNVLNIADLGLNTFLNNKYNPVGADGNRRYNGTINASSGLLELHVGRDSGATLALGTGGTDIGMTALANSYEGMKYFGKNLQIEAAAHAAKMGNAATALRMQYGYGTDEQKQNLNDILSGKAVLRSGGTDGRAKTVSENGKRTIYLNEYSDKMTREEMFRMGITLGHEAYRDGIVTTPDGQFAETAGAVFGHTLMAKQMQADGMYGSIMNGIINGDANLSADIAAFDKALASNDWSSFGSYVGDKYDSSADYWKLVSRSNGENVLLPEYDANGILIKDLTIVYEDLDENGDWEEVSRDFFKDKTKSQSASLAAILGEQRASEILKFDVNDISNFSNEVLTEVFGVDYEQKISSGNIKEIDKQKLIGETLLRNAGFTPDGNKWNGKSVNLSKIQLTETTYLNSFISNITGSSKLDVSKITADVTNFQPYMNLVRNNDTMGYILFNRVKPTDTVNPLGLFSDRFVVNAEVVRNADSWDAHYMASTDSKGNTYTQRDYDGTLASLNRGLDEIIYRKYDLKNNQIGDDYVTYAQTIDVYNKYDSKDKVDRTQPYYDATNSRWLQGNTVNSSFSLLVDSLDKSDEYSMTIHNFTTIDGSYVDKFSDSYDANGNLTPGGHWRVHSSEWLTSDGCFIYTFTDHDNMQKYLYDVFGVRAGHQIHGTIR